MRTYTKLALALAVFISVSNSAFADGNAFTPLNFEDASSYSAPKAVQPAPEAAVSPASANPISNALSKIMPVKKDVPGLDMVSTEPSIINSNIQNAILEIDNAQVGIRNDLLNYKAKYADVNAQYQLIKNERNMLHKQIVSIEKRIRNLDKAKDKIRKNML